MNLSDLNSGPVAEKGWLKIQADTIQSRITASEISFTEGEEAIVTNSSQLNLTADQVVNSVMGFKIASSNTVVMPSATALNNFIGNIPSDLQKYSFKFHAVNSQDSTAGANVFFITTLGPPSFYDNTATLSLTPGQSREFVFFADTTIGWRIYY